MDVKEENVAYKLLCNACLCVGRTLHTITNEKTQKYYMDALDEIPLFNLSTVSLQVCWECKALLEKCIAFREQVQDSYRILQTYTQEDLNECLLTDVSRPPRLKVHLVESTSISPSEGYETHMTYYAEVPVVCVKDELKEDWGSDQDDTNVLEDTFPLSDSSENNKNFESELQNILGSMKRDEKRKRGSKTKREKKIKRSKVDKKVAGKPKPTKSQNPKFLTIELTYEEMLLERERESTRESYTKAEYKCESCLIGFNYSKSYTDHVAARHSSNLGDYICPICKTIISSVESFTAHYKRHMRRYECSICQKRTLDIKVMQQHYYSTHEISLKEYTCNICGKISNSIDTHRYHKDTHKARVQCTECDKTFRHRAGLMNHRLAVHEYRNKFPCTVCDKVFRWKTSLKRHLVKHEVNGKSSSSEAYCALCNVSFSSIFSFQRHLKNSLKHVTHDQLRFICDHCNKRFADKTKLRDHIEEKHLHKTYQCHICLKPSKNRVGLDQHIRNVHKRQNNKMCHHCGKGFPNKVQLESHIRTHTGERPFICEFCPTTFSQQSNLSKHNRQVHLNIKSKRYPMCKKKDEEKTAEVAILDHVQPIEQYRPVPMLHYTAEKVFSM